VSVGQDAAAPRFVDVEQHLLTPAQPGIGRVVESRLCTAGGSKSASFVRHVSIDVSGTPLAGRFKAGQSFGVIPPGTDERGRPHKLRLYSIASPSQGEDGKGEVLATTVKRTIDEHWENHTLFLGVASNYLCDLQVGDEVRVTGPAGKRFVLPADPDEHDFVFFATGTGIAPCRAMALELLEGGGSTRSRVTLVMGAPYASDLLYHDELTDLAHRHDRFTYLTALSREPQDDDPGRMYVSDRVRTHGEILSDLLEGDRGLVYVCGLAGMEIGVLRGLAVLLGPEGVRAYVDADTETLSDPSSWERRMIPRTLRPTKRTMLEVY